MAEIEFQDVPAYRCPTCEHRVTVSPCPACVALRRGGPAVVADALLVAAGRRAERASNEATRAAAAVL